MSCMHRWDAYTETCLDCSITRAQYHAASQQLGISSALGLQAVMMFSYAKGLEVAQSTVPESRSSLLWQGHSQQSAKRKTVAWGIWVRW